MAFIRLLLHDSPSAAIFIIAFRLCAIIIIHHQAAFSPKSPEVNFPPAKSSFITEWASSLLPQRSCCQCIVNAYKAIIDAKKKGERYG
jgi:hypothetical protein